MQSKRERRRLLLKELDYKKFKLFMLSLLWRMGVAPDWEPVRPLLDEALERLNRTDRDAVLLRVIEGRSFQEVGSLLQMSEEAARKRVSHGLEKLRAYPRNRLRYLSCFAKRSI